MFVAGVGGEERIICDGGEGGVRIWYAEERELLTRSWRWSGR